MVKINLLPDVVLQRRRESRIKRIAFLSIIGWAGLIGAVALGVFGYAAFHATKLNGAKEVRDQVRAEVYAPDVVASRNEALQAQASLAALTQLFDRRYSTVVFLKSLGEIATKNIQFTDVLLENDREVLISGKAASYEEVSRFEEALKKLVPQRDELAQKLRDEPSDLGSESPVLPWVYSNITLLGVSSETEDTIGFDVRMTYSPPVTLDNYGSETNPAPAVAR